MNLSDPCDPNKDVVNEAIIAMNESGDCGEAALEAALDGVDEILEEKNFTECPKVKCIYDLLDNSNNGLFCSTFGELFDSDNFKLTLRTGNRFSDVSGGDVSTSYYGDDIVITIADDLCNGNELPYKLQERFFMKQSMQVCMKKQNS